MKVKCHRIISPGSGKDMTSSSLWLTPGKIYVVLALRIHTYGGIKVALLSDQDYSPMLSDLLGFEVISQNTPEHWITRINEYGIVNKMPERWFAHNFLEAVDDDDPEAMKIFLEEAAIAYEEEGEILPMQLLDY